MESPPCEQVVKADPQMRAKTPGSVKKFMKRFAPSSAKKRRLERDDKLVKRHKPSNEFTEQMINKAVPRKMHGTTKMLTEMALNSPKLANEKIKKVKSAIAGTPMKVAGMMKRNMSLYSRTPKGETKVVDEWNRRISMVRKEAASDSVGGHLAEALWSNSEWAKLHPDLPMKEIRLQEIFNEFIEKELAYTDSIGLIQTVYRKAFTMCDFSQFDESPADIDYDLFANIDRIIDLQVGFKADLENLRKTSNGLIRHFGSFFTEWFMKFSSYIPYCGHIGAMKKRYDALLDKSEDFSRLVKQLQLLEQCEKKDLWTLLDEPRRHFLRYNLMLKSALKQLEKIQASSNAVEEESDSGSSPKPQTVDEDIGNVSDALNVIGRLGVVMNRGYDTISDEIIMRTLRSNLVFTDESERQEFEIPEDSQLLFHGILSNRDGKGIHVFLAHDYIVFTRESRGNGGKARFQVPKHMQPISVKDVDVRMVEPTDPGVANFGRAGSIVGRNRPSSAKKPTSDCNSMMYVLDVKREAIYMLKARTQEGRDAWMHAIREAGVAVNVKSQVAVARDAKRVQQQLLDLNALPSPTLAHDGERPSDTVGEESMKKPESPAAGAFTLNDGDDQFLQLRSKLKYSENTPHVTPQRVSVRDCYVGDGDCTIKKFDFTEEDSECVKATGEGASLTGVDVGSALLVNDRPAADGDAAEASSMKAADEEQVHDAKQEVGHMEEASHNMVTEGIAKVPSSGRPDELQSLSTVLSNRVATEEPAKTADTAAQQATTECEAEVV